MATTYLQLVNDCNARTNEAQLTSSNFASAAGSYQVVKQAVNDAIRRTGQEVFEWPFFHVDYDETLVAGTIRYAYQTDTKTVDFDSFRVQRDATIGNVSQYLQKIDYEEYLERQVDDEYNTSDTGIRRLPQYVFQCPNQEYGVWPAPDAAYTLSYEYYKYPTDLSAHGDTMEYPDGFRQIIADLAMYFVYQFRSDYENADRVKELAKEGLKNMRSIYVNRYDHIRDDRVSVNFFLVPAGAVCCGCRVICLCA